MTMRARTFRFHRASKGPRALCDCSKTQTRAPRREKETAKPSAKNFCCHATSSSTSISSPNSENDTLKGIEVCGAIEAHQKEEVRSSRAKSRDTAAFP